MSSVECRGLPTLTMAVDELGTMVIARDAILRVVAPLRARFYGEPKMDARLKKMDPWIPGFLDSWALGVTALSNQPLKTGPDAHWRVEQGG